MKTHIFYHSADKDGHCSGAIANHFALEHKMSPILHPIDHGEGFPWSEIESEDQVWMLDFSLPIETMKSLYFRQDGRFIWIDHHIGRIREYNEDPSAHIAGSRDVDFAACELAWKFFYPGVEVPKFIVLLGRYDVWDHSENIARWRNIEGFQYGFGVQVDSTDPKDSMVIWDDYLIMSEQGIMKSSDSNYDDCPCLFPVIEDGVKIKKHIEQRYERDIRDRSYTVNWEGYRCLVINSDPYIANYMTSSVAFKDCDIAINYARKKNDYWVVNLRTNKSDIDLSALAGKYKGGGHAGASGFSWEERMLPWDLSGPEASRGSVAGARCSDLGFA